MVTKPKARKTSPNDKHSNNVKQIFSSNHTVLKYEKDIKRK